MVRVKVAVNVKAKTVASTLPFSHRQDCQVLLTVGGKARLRMTVVIKVRVKGRIAADAEIDASVGPKPNPTAYATPILTLPNLT